MEQLESPRAEALRSTAARQRGTVLLAALLFSIVILAFVSAIITSGASVQDQHRTLRAALRAADAAESGVHAVLGVLNGPGALPLLDSGSMEDVVQGSGERAVRFRATIAPGADDKIDNDGDGATDEPDEADVYEIVSTGWADDISRTVRVTCLARYNTPTVPSAVYIGDPNGGLRMDSNAFLISGHDVDLEGGRTGELVPGLGVTGAVERYETALRQNLQDNVVGLGGSPSIHAVDPIDVAELVAEAARAADVTLGSGSAQAPAEEGAWGTMEHPSIVFGSGEIHISGGASGAGILVVNGDLKITGAFEWKGLIVVHGDVSFGGGGGGKRLVGGLIVERGLREDPTLTSDVKFAGTVDVLFSKETLERISHAFAVYVVLNWREGPNPTPEP